MDELIARFDAAVPDHWDPYDLPTVDSLAAVEAHFAFRIPPLLIEFAYRSKSYSSFFLSLGPNIENHSHIITKNKMVRSHEDWLRSGHGVPAPKNLVFFTENHMEDFFWGFDISHPDPVYPVAIWQSDEPGKQCFTDFSSFLIAQIEYYEGKGKR